MPRNAQKCPEMPKENGYSSYDSIICNDAIAVEY